MKNIFFAILVALCVQVQAATYHWDGTTADWNTIGNWKVGNATSTATMQVLPVATQVPGSGDIVVIAYHNGIDPILSSNVTLAVIYIFGNKTLDMNGFNFTIWGLTTTNGIACGFYSGMLKNSSSQAAVFKLDPASCLPQANVRPTNVEISNSFKFGATTADLFSVIFNSNNSSCYISMVNSTSNVPLSISHPNISISGCTFQKDLFVYKGSGTGSAATSYIGQNTYYGNLDVMAYKGIVMGDDNNVSQFLGIGKTMTLGTGDGTSNLTLKNFNVANNVTILGSGSYFHSVNINRFTFNGSVAFAKSVYTGDGFILDSPKFMASNIDNNGNNVVMNTPIFVGDKIINNNSGNTTINNVDASNSSYGSLSLNAIVGSLAVNTSTINGTVNVSTSGTGTGSITLNTCTVSGASNIVGNGNASISYNTCTLSSSLNLSGTGAGSITLTSSTLSSVSNVNHSGTSVVSFVSCNVNENITVAKTLGTGTVNISNPNFASGKNVSLGSSGFSSGILKLTGDWSSLNSPLNLTLSGTGVLIFNNLTINQPITAVSPSMQMLSTCLFNEEVNLTVLNNASTYANWGAVTFEKDLTIDVRGYTSYVYVVMGATGNCLFKGNVNVFYTNHNNGPIAFGPTSLAYKCEFKKNLNINNIKSTIQIYYIAMSLTNVLFSGTQEQNLNITAPVLANRIKVQNSGGLKINSTVGYLMVASFNNIGKFDFTLGKVYINTPYPMMFSGSAVWENASKDSYAIGEVGRSFSTNNLDYIYPVGNESSYCPLVIYASTLYNAISVEYKRETPVNQPMGTTKDISDCEYWILRNRNTYADQVVPSNFVSSGYQFMLKLPWTQVNNCTPINPSIMGISVSKNSSWNEEASTLAAGSTAQSGQVDGTGTLHTAMFYGFNMLVTHSYKSAIRLDVSGVKPSNAVLSCSFDSKPLVGGQTPLARVHPNYGETADLNIEGDANSEALPLKIPMSATGEPTGVNLGDDTPLNPSLYTITGNTIKFYNEPTDATVFEAYTMNTTTDGITLNSSLTLTVTPPSNIKILGYKMNGAASYTSVTLANGAALSLNISSLATYPAGSRNSIILSVSDGTNTFDVQGYFIKP